MSVEEWDQLNNFAVASIIDSCASAVIHYIVDCKHDAYTYWTKLQDSIWPTNAQGAVRLLTHFWLLLLPSALSETYEIFAKEYKANLITSKATKVTIDTIYLSHLFAALPASLA